ncbi:g1905 [Coccomyxa viridis]|uniref:G1905 protein n=1 Tax=Coccomyxa viridis TaxID=1274662 RepID=A0ABP1FJ37_9CHLO
MAFTFRGAHTARGSFGSHLSSQPSTAATSSQDVHSTAAFQTPPTYVQANGRIIAIGDIHGDLQKTVTSLKVAGVLEEDRNGRPLWCGGDTVVVQLGDVLDRGDCEIGSILLLRELDRQARMQGGAVYMLNGNHESLNVAGNFRYVTPGGFRESALVAGLSPDALNSMESKVRARMRLYRPGGQMACELAKNPTVLIVNDSVFAHGGVLAQHVKYGLEKMNEEVAAWMLGLITEDGTKSRPPFLAMGSSQSVMWNRDFGQERFKNLQQRWKACMDVEGMLKLLGARQLIIGHTPQTIGANCECNGRVWRMDVGMSKGVLNARPQVLEIEPVDARGNTKVRILSPPLQALLPPPPPPVEALRSHYPI